MEELSIFFALAVTCVVYGAIARTVGMRILAFRSEWLDSPQLLNRIVKNTLAVLIGMWIAWAYIFWIVIKFIFYMCMKS